jgi:hypothetical protein
MVAAKYRAWRFCGSLLVVDDVSPPFLLRIWIVSLLFLVHLDLNTPRPRRSNLLKTRFRIILIEVFQLIHQGDHEA